MPAFDEWPVMAHKRQPSDHNSLDLIEAELIAPAIVELRRARRGMVRHRRRLFECAAVLELGGDPGRPEAVVAERLAGSGRPPHLFPPRFHSAGKCRFGLVTSNINLLQSV